MNNTKIVSMPVTKAFMAPMISALAKLVDDGYQIDLSFPNDNGGIPVTKGAKYKLRMAGRCGLVFDHDEDDHIHVRGKRIAEGFESIGAEIVCSLEVATLIDNWVREEPKRLMEEMQTLFDKFIAVKKFQPGDKVSDSGLHEYRYPKKGTYGLFVGYLSNPIGERGEEDCEIMVRNNDGDVVITTLDSRHLQMWNGEEVSEEEDAVLHGCQKDTRRWN